MNFTKEDLKKPESWIIIAPVIFLILGLVSTFSLGSAKKQAQSKVTSAKNVVKDGTEILQYTTKFGISLFDEDDKEDFDTITSMIKCAQAARIPKDNIQHIAGEKPKLLRDGKMSYRERFELHNVRIEQIGIFIDFAEKNFNSLVCSNLAITPSANRTSKDRWNTTLEFEHTK